jgi:hypothetical protein
MTINTVLLRGLRENECARPSGDFNRNSPNELWNGVDNSRWKGSRHIDESIYRELRRICVVIMSIKSGVQRAASTA